jgi:hypothetical protein
MNNRIGLLERIFLLSNAWQDGRKNAFYEVQTQVSGKKIILSAFISMELTNLSVYAQNLFHRRWCWVTLYNRNYRRYHRLMRLSEALTLIDLQISTLESEFYKSYTDDKPVRQLINKRNAATERSEEHLARMYSNRLIEIERQMGEKLNRYHLTVEALLDEKIRLLGNTFTLHDHMSARYLKRIQYYYSVACRIKRKLPVAPLKMSDYTELTDSAVLMHYCAELESTIERRKQLHEKKILKDS